MARVSQFLDKRDKRAGELTLATLPCFVMPTLMEKETLMGGTAHDLPRDMNGITYMNGSSTASQ